MMRALLVSSCVVLGAAGAIWKTVADPSPHAIVQERVGDLVWERRLSPAVEKAKHEGKPLLVVFRCPP